LIRAKNSLVATLKGKEMPKGVYPRKKKDGSISMPREVEPGRATSISGLYSHLQVLTETRTKLFSPSVDFSSDNVQLRTVIDTEIFSTVQALKKWREDNFPYGSVAPVKETQKAVQVATSGNPPPAPLPFTPQAAAQHAKEQNQ
jgi:hypothetical protein